MCCFLFSAQHSFVANVSDSKPLRELIAEAKAEVTEEIEEHKEEEEEEEVEAHPVCVHTYRSWFCQAACKNTLFCNSNFVICHVSHLNNLTLIHFLKYSISEIERGNANITQLLQRRLYYHLKMFWVNCSLLLSKVKMK